MIRWWKQPLAGDLVWCFFPQDQQLEPGPKPRPGLILEVRRVLGSEQQFAVKVAYGTSTFGSASLQKVDPLYSGEFLIDRPDGAAFQLSGLSYPTKFDIAKIAELPYNDQWFAVPPQPRHGQTPKLGTLHASLMPRLRAARESRS